MDVCTKLTILQSFIWSNFTYCCHIWYFCSLTLGQKVEKIQFRGLRYVYHDYHSSNMVLLERSGLQSIDLLIQKTILVEIYKSLNGQEAWLPQFSQIMSSCIFLWSAVSHFFVQKVTYIFWKKVRGVRSNVLTKSQQLSIIKVTIDIRVLIF